MKKSDCWEARSDLFGEAEAGTNFTITCSFSGTTNPRHLRVIQSLLNGPKTRETLDMIAGCSNSPDLIYDLRKLGLGKEGLPCQLVPIRDRDGSETRRGVYSFSCDARRVVISWLRKHRFRSGALVANINRVPELQNDNLLTLRSSGDS